MSEANAALIGAIRHGLAERADPARAPRMQAYMKSAMPYYGVAMPEARRLFKQVFAQFRIDSAEAWQATSLTLFREASHREEWYAAVELAEYRKYRAYQTLAALPMYEEMIVTGAWWDVVDAVAGHHVCTHLQREAATMKPIMRKWSRSENLWKRRSAIICQIGLKRDTDLELLYDCIQPNLADRDFFIRKAIGWALREYAKTDPAEVVRYVRLHESALSGLSKREALKNL